MIDKDKLSEFVKNQLAGSDMFLVDLTVTPDNRIAVEVDSTRPIDIDSCAALTRAIEGAFDRDEEDYELEVGSAGLTSPFKVREQYKKNIGNEVEVLAKDGKKYKGILTSAGESDFTVNISEKVKREGEKRPVVEERPHTFRYDEIKYAKYLLQF